MEPDSDDETIRRAFRRLALDLHPDVNGDEDAQQVGFVQVQRQVRSRGTWDLGKRL